MAGAKIVYRRGKKEAGNVNWPEHAALCKPL